ncbi:MAG: hypothetical protein QOH06_3464 [Acidobacteriota bacterium]|jgi:hypothetical protein|nr:hypothetical protein [Acidobacteriota bacterium]
MNLRNLSDRSASRLTWAFFALGLAISLFMVARSQVGGDQLNLLGRGWLLADEGHWISYGNPMSTGGKAPGGITSLLVGIPLMVWRDHRAPTLVILLCHVLAYLILDRTLRRVFGPRERVLFSVLYWLNPWRMYFSAFLWNPNYLFLFGAVHLWTCWTQRERARFVPSFLLGAGLLLAFQIHASFLLLAVASIFLWWRGYFKPHWTGGILGAVLAALPLVPWVLDLMRQPAILTEADKGFLGRGLLYVFPLLRGIIYWFRYSSLAASEKMLRFDFGDFLDPEAGARLGAQVSTVASVLLPLTLVLPLLANIRLWRRNWRKKLPAGASDRTWLKGYVQWTFVAAVVVFSLSPTTIMMWQALIVLHAAVLPLVLWAGVLGRSRHAGRVSRGLWIGLWVYTAAEIFLLLLIPLGSTHYRCAGHDGSDSFGLALRHDHRMLHELHIHATCPLPVNRTDGWWPDVLPE